MNQVRRAIIMAAGEGKRMRPVTLKTPKPLVPVKGSRMIDSVIKGLQMNGICEIYIVVGYQKEKFRCLEKEYPGVVLLENPWYSTSNNISSLYVARNYIEEAIILDGDQVILNPKVLELNFQCSGYNCIWTDRETDEWLLTVENGVVTHCNRNGGGRGWQLFSISRWSKEDGRKLKRHIEIEFEEKKNRQIFWDDVALFCYSKEYKLGIREMRVGDVIELDSLKELAMFDETYMQFL